MTERKLRYALVGVGANVYNMHKAGLELDCNEVVAVCDIREEPAKREAEFWGCPYFLDYRQMIAETEADALVVMVPHTLHAEMSIHAMRAGLHVLCEKPMAIHVAEADEMIKVAQETGKILAINFQQRLRPEVMAAKELIDEGRLGTIQQVDIKITWTRTYKYYREAGWRGTWAGEGGALLMNQAPHDLDMICHLVGMPKRLYAWTPTIAHQIAPEDTAQAMLQWDNGAIGSFHASTAEAGQPQRFEIIGTGGHLQVNRGSLRFASFDTDVIEFIKTSDKAFAEPNLIEESIPLDTSFEGTHRDVHRDFYNAIVHGKPVSADGVTGIRGLELANAMIYSNYTGQVVEFPLDRQQYAALLADLRAKEAATS
ncbi:MAG TPA: Gfo/Idh/MocA family oxidoreductase [Spirillospora sp.]|nr:Gfo/Idh/MocA family oxidoreductase [Spirillospora sp.]